MPLEKKHASLSPPAYFLCLKVKSTVVAPLEVTDAAVYIPNGLVEILGRQRISKGVRIWLEKRIEFVLDDPQIHKKKHLSLKGIISHENPSRKPTSMARKGPKTPSEAART